MSDLDKINSIFNAKIDSVKTKEDLQKIKTEFFGKNGQITIQFKTLGSLNPEKRKDFASNLNKIKDDLTNQIEQKDFEIRNTEINEKLKETYASLNSWQRTQVARHEDRPKANFYIKKIFSQFTLLSGDRFFDDDK